MALLGKLTLSILGFKFFGIYGMFWGLCLGHMFIDRTIISKLISDRLSDWDDDLRLMLPYKYYSFYDNFLSPMFGKIWGIVLGSITYGWIGFAVGAVLGHFAFDTKNDKIEKFENEIDKTFRENIFLLIGFTIGHTIGSKFITLVGMIVGVCIDILRMENGLVSRLKLSSFTNFWPRINILKLSLNSPEARKAALVKSMAELSAELIKSEGEVTNYEISVFKRLFNISSEEDMAMIVFNKSISTAKNYESSAKQLKYIVGDDIEVKEDIIENLFEIAAADGNITMSEIDMLKKIAKIIDFPDGNFEVVRKRYEIANNFSDYKDYYKVLGINMAASDKEIRDIWRKLTASYHPDKIIANGGTEKDIKEGTSKMAEINEAYQQIMKQRKTL